MRLLSYRVVVFTRPGLRTGLVSAVSADPAAYDVVGINKVVKELCTWM